MIPRDAKEALGMGYGVIQTRKAMINDILHLGSLLESTGQFFGDIGILGSSIDPDDQFDRNLAMAAEER